jgi:3-hydroxyacyl-[acyl-carrier-protein] dehydratase
LRLLPGASEEEFGAEFRFDPGLALFAGHFPGRPLLPGVLQLELVRLAAERALCARFRIVRVPRAKFTGQVLPGQRIVLEATVRPGGEELTVRATLRVEQATVATISLVLKRADDGA